MDSTIIAAIIAGIAAVLAALIGVFRFKNSQQNAKGLPSAATIEEAREITDNIIASRNINVVRSNYYGPVTQISTEKTSTKFDFTSPDAVNTGVQNHHLIFITEDEIQDRKGLALNFTLRNYHSESIVIYSLKLELVEFFNNSSEKFEQWLASSYVPPSSMLCAPVYVTGIKTLIFPSKKTCNSTWGSWDDSDGNAWRLSKLDGNSFRTMREIIDQAQDVRSSSKGPSYELLPPDVRFSQKPMDTDSFHCRLMGGEEGIYSVKFAVGYHLGNEKREIFSDKEYAFVSVNDFHHRFWSDKKSK